MTAIVTAGRTDLTGLFSMSGILDGMLNHTPFLAFVDDGDRTKVRIVDRAADLALLPPETPVMVQWRGRWRSDFFQMTVADVRLALESRKPEVRP